VLTGDGVLAAPAFPRTLLDAAHSGDGAPAVAAPPGSQPPRRWPVAALWPRHPPALVPVGIVGANYTGGTATVTTPAPQGPRPIPASSERSRNTDTRKQQ
jgi:hypothetical protein